MWYQLKTCVMCMCMLCMDLTEGSNIVFFFCFVLIKVFNEMKRTYNSIFIVYNVALDLLLSVAIVSILNIRFCVGSFPCANSHIAFTDDWMNGLCPLFFFHIYFLLLVSGFCKQIRNNQRCEVGHKNSWAFSFLILWFLLGSW